ncbi:MAG: hypothetical protein O2921_11165 [Chloroflexi bacterium]|nr:hypothetical protein [Chloroflexota bacterium]MDA1283155.1 hypothetical protein [Chloroflexota bacterium]
MFSGIKNKWLVLVAIAAVAAFVIACGTDETKLVSNDGGVGAQPTETADGDKLPNDLGYEVVDELAPIESVQIMVLESYPEQFVVQVISGMPSGCASFSHSEVTHEGTDIHISVYNSVPAPEQLAVMSCIAIYGIHEENVSLGSDFDSGTVYSVYVNDQPAVTFETGSSPIQVDPAYADPGFEIVPAPVEAIEIIIGEDSRGPVTYYANVIIGLTSGCNEAVDPNVVMTSRSVFEVFLVVKVPTGDVMCTDDYRLEGVEVTFGAVGEELVSCAVYTVHAGDKTETFQAIAPNVRCADPDLATPTTVPGGGGSLIADSQALELTLRSLGADVSYGGHSDFSKQFGLYPTELKVNGQRVLVYSFAPGTSAEKASETVSSDGSSFEGDGVAMSVMWIEPPHFYLFGNAIILYIGVDAEMGALLGSIGDQFAGGEYETASGEEDGINSEFIARLATIENVSIASTRSIPAQHMIGVTIALGGSCETFKSITKVVEGREVHIEVLTQVPTAPVPCTLAIIYDDQSINIGSDFEAGVEYDVIVNVERQGTFIGG